MKARKGQAKSVVEEAETRSAAWIEAIAAGRVRHRSNAGRIVLVCKDLLAARPVRNPLSPVVAEVGKLRYPDFPADQSLLNRYGPLLSIWRDAFRQIIDVSAPAPPKLGDRWSLDEADIQALDHGTRGRVQLMLAANRELVIENRRLRHLIGQDVPAPSGSSLPREYGGPERIRAVRTVKDWLEGLSSPAGSLEEVPAGLKLSRRASPGQLVVGSEMLEAVRVLCRDDAASSISGEGVEIIRPRPSRAGS